VSVSRRRINLTAQLATVRHAEIPLHRSGGRRGSEPSDLPVNEVHLNRSLLLKLSFEAQCLASKDNLHLNLELSRGAHESAPRRPVDVGGRASNLPQSVCHIFLSVETNRYRSSSPDEPPSVRGCECWFANSLSLAPQGNTPNFNIELRKILDLNRVVSIVPIVCFYRQFDRFRRFSTLIIADVQWSTPIGEDFAETCDYFVVVGELDGIQLDLLTNSFDRDSPLNEQRNMQRPAKHLLHEGRNRDFLFDPYRGTGCAVAFNSSSMVHYYDQADRFVQASKHVLGERLQSCLILGEIPVESRAFRNQIAYTFPQVFFFVRILPAGDKDCSSWLNHVGHSLTGAGKLRKTRIELGKAEN
jgi:hypothetical protein